MFLLYSKLQTDYNTTSAVFDSLISHNSRTGVLYAEKSSLVYFISVIHKLFLQIFKLYINFFGDG